MIFPRLILYLNFMLEFLDGLFPKDQPPVIAQTPQVVDFLGKHGHSELNRPGVISWQGEIPQAKLDLSCLHSSGIIPKPILSHLQRHETITCRLEQRPRGQNYTYCLQLNDLKINWGNSTGPSLSCALTSDHELVGSLQNAHNRPRIKTWGKAQLETVFGTMLEQIIAYAESQEQLSKSGNN